MRSSRSRRKAVSFTLFNLPSLLVYTVFWVLPIGFNLIISFTSWNGVVALSDIKWVQFRNYANLLKDSIFWKAISHNFQFTLLNVIFIPTLAFIIAVCIEKGVKRKGFFRTTLFIPATLTMMLVAILFRWIYSIDDGIINSFLGFIGLESLQTDFLGNSKTALNALFVMGLWKTLPFYMTIILSGLQGVPQDLEEAARIDGCGLLKTLRHVTIPVLKPVLTVVYALVIIDGFRVFDLVFVATKGGPANSTTVMATYVYDIAFKDFRLGYATALSTINIFVVLVISAVYFRFGMKSNTE